MSVIRVSNLPCILACSICQLVVLSAAAATTAAGGVAATPGDAGAAARDEAARCPVVGCAAFGFRGGGRGLPALAGLLEHSAARWPLRVTPNLSKQCLHATA